MLDHEHDLWMAEHELLLMGWLGRLLHPGRAQRLRLIRDDAKAKTPATPILKKTNDLPTVLDIGPATPLMASFVELAARLNASARKKMARSRIETRDYSLMLNAEAGALLELSHELLAVAQGMSAGTAETAKQAQGEARQPGPKDAPNPSPPSPTES